MLATMVPMSDTDDRIIRFPGLKPADTKTGEKTAGKPVDVPDEIAAAKSKKSAKKSAAADPMAAATAAMAALDEDRQKAIQVIMSGMPYVCVGIQPTDKGADFFTATGGDEAEIAKASPHLASVIERLLRRRGIID